MTHAVSGSVRIDTYAFEVGIFTESYAAFESEREDENVNAVREALAQAGEVRTPVAALEKLQANAETVTSKCERAHELSRAAAEGRLLEADAVMAESVLGGASTGERPHHRPDGVFPPVHHLRRGFPNLGEVLELTRPQVFEHGFVQ